MLDGVESIAVPAAFRRIGVVIVIEDPALEVDRVDDQRVAFPLPDRITVVRRLEPGPMGTAVERDDPGGALELGNNDDVFGMLNDLDRENVEHPRGEA